MLDTPQSITVISKELIQDQAGALAMGMQLPVPVIPLGLPAYSKKETADFSVISTWGVFYPDADSGANLILLNVRKGPAVQVPRAQCDKKAYQFRMKWLIENQPNLDLHQGNTAEILAIPYYRAVMEEADTGAPIPPAAKPQSASH